MIPPRPRRFAVALMAVATGLTLPALGAPTIALASVGGDARGAAADSSRLGPVPGGELLDGQVVLRLADPGGLARAAVPGRALPRAVVSSRFGPAPADVAGVVSHLSGAGLRVTSVSGTLVQYRGPAAAVSRAFGVPLARYRAARTGLEYHTAEAAPRLPATLARTVVGVFGLDSRPAWRSHLQRGPRAGAPGGPAPGTLGPAAVRAAYRVDGGTLTGQDGSGQTVGILELAIESAAQLSTDLLGYDQQYYPVGQVNGTMTPVVVGAGPTLADASGQEEADLDIQLVRAMAPKANIRVYLAPNTSAGVNAAYQQMSQEVTVISTSWGQCEPAQDSADPGETAALAGIFQQASATGVTTFAASGDAGAYDCRSLSDPSDAANNPFHNTVTVDSPASDPNVVAVGGFSGRLGGATWQTPIAAWSDRNTGQLPPVGTGGGLSGDNRPPVWQAGPGVVQPGTSNGFRQVPDVAVAADPRTDAYSVNTVDGSGVPTWMGIAGTSAGPPIWAGFMALYRQAHPGAAVNEAPLFYSAAQCPQAYTPYDDVTGGDNLYYSARAGWDLATGWGGLNADQLTRAIDGQGAAPLAISSVSPTSGPAAGGTRVTITGCGFGQSTRVTVGGHPGTSVTVVSPSVLQVTTPPGAVGPADVGVSTGGPGPTLAGAFTYQPTVLVAGTGFGLGAHVLQGGGITYLGGQLIGSPAVAGTASVAPILVGTGTDHNLYVRSAGPGAGWQPLTPAPTYCNDGPAAVILGGNLWVACEGGDQGLWYASVPYSGGQLPSVPRLAYHPLGGQLSAGPAINQLSGSGSPTFAVVGTDQHVYMRTPQSGWSGFTWSCIGHPALATTGGTTYFACHGTDDHLYTAQYQGGGWSWVTGHGGVLVDGVGIAASSVGVSYFCIGTDGQVWQLTGGRWLPAGDQLRYGVTSVALS